MLDATWSQDKKNYKKLFSENVSIRIALFYEAIDLKNCFNINDVWKIMWKVRGGVRVTFEEVERSQFNANISEFSTETESNVGI